MHTRLDQRATPFDDWATTYAHIYGDCTHSSYFFRRRKELVISVLAEEPPGKILDVGCGPGLMATPAIEQGHRFHGMDISRAMVAECQRQFPGSTLATFSTGAVQCLPVAAGMFSAVLCMGVLEYVPHDELDRSLREIFRALAPGGLLVLSCLNARSPFWAAKRILRTLRSGEADSTLPTVQFRRQVILQRLREAGLEPRSTRYFAFNLMPTGIFKQFPRKAGALSLLLERLTNTPLRWLGLAFLVTARKPGDSAADVGYAGQPTPPTP